MYSFEVLCFGPLRVMLCGQGGYISISMTITHGVHLLETSTLNGSIDSVHSMTPSPYKNTVLDTGRYQISRAATVRPSPQTTRPATLEACALHRRPLVHSITYLSFVPYLLRKHQILFSLLSFVKWMHGTARKYPLNKILKAKRTYALLSKISCNEASCGSQYF